MPPVRHVPKKIEVFLKFEVEERLVAKNDECEIIKSVCALCFMVCGIDAHMKDGKLVRVEGMKEHAATKGVICPRGYHLPDYIYSPHRIKYPMMKGKDGNMEQVSCSSPVKANH